MAEYRTRTGQFNLRVVILRRVLGAKQDNGEDLQTWPEEGARGYYAARETLTAGEDIMQGINNATGSMKLRIKGRHITVDAFDRLMVKHTGEMFHIAGVSRDGAETVLSVDRVRSQTVGQ
jgi:head-tail adaptor